MVCLLYQRCVFIDVWSTFRSGFVAYKSSGLQEPTTCDLTARRQSLSLHSTSRPIIRPFLWPPALSISQRTGAYNSLAFKIHTLECGTKGNRHSRLPSLFSASHNTYSKHMSCLIQGWNQGNGVKDKPCSWQIYERQCACQAGNAKYGGGERRRGRPLFVFVGKESIESHLVSCQTLPSSDRHKVNWISHWEAFLPSMTSRAANS